MNCWENICRVNNKKTAILKGEKIMPQISFRLLFIFILMVLLVPAGYGDAEPVDKLPDNARCSVCGMFVAKYPNWLAQIHYDTSDETKYFDGVKDMMVFYFNPEHYGGSVRENIKNMFVKDYYSLSWLPAKEAFYVIGSDVYGPMGHEFIPFQSREGAESFSKDHHGKNILRFDEITPEIVESLRMNQKMR
jgi:copper chaperone NosL